MSDYQINQYSREEIVQSLKRIRDKYPNVFEHFFMHELRRQPMIISEKDAKYLQGTPAPLKITIPVTIEEGNEDE